MPPSEVHIYMPRFHLQISKNCNKNINTHAFRTDFMEIISIVGLEWERNACQLFFEAFGKIEKLKIKIYLMKHSLNAALKYKKWLN